MTVIFLCSKIRRISAIETRAAIRKRKVKIVDETFGVIQTSLDDVWQQNMWSRQDGRYSIFNRIISASKFLKYSRVTAEILFVSCALFSIGNPKIKFK